MIINCSFVIVQVYWVHWPQYFKLSSDHPPPPSRSNAMLEILSHHCIWNKWLSVLFVADTKSLEAFYMILDVWWYQHVTNADIMSLTSIPSRTKHNTVNPAHLRRFCSPSSRCQGNHMVSLSGIARIYCEEGHRWKLCLSSGTHSGLQDQVQQLLDE